MKEVMTGKCEHRCGPGGRYGTAADAPLFACVRHAEETTVDENDHKALGALYATHFTEERSSHETVHIPVRRAALPYA
jgi:hypothetical protein